MNLNNPEKNSQNVNKKEKKEIKHPVALACKPYTEDIIDESYDEKNSIEKSNLADVYHVVILDDDAINLSLYGKNIKDKIKSLKLPFVVYKINNGIHGLEVLRRIFQENISKLILVSDNDFPINHFTDKKLKKDVVGLGLDIISQLVEKGLDPKHIICNTGTFNKIFDKDINSIINQKNKEFAIVTEDKVKKMHTIVEKKNNKKQINIVEKGGDCSKHICEFVENFINNFNIDEAELEIDAAQNVNWDLVINQLEEKLKIAEHKMQELEAKKEEVDNLQKYQILSTIVGTMIYKNLIQNRKNRKKK